MRGRIIVAKNITTASEKATALPIDYGLAQNYPNPFNSETTITWQIPSQAEVSLQIYNSAGQCVRNLLQGMYAAGSYSQRWDGRDDQGLSVGSGIYIAHFSADGRIFDQKMILVR
jgi:flagellar hook assembly protein FlgD